MNYVQALLTNGPEPGEADICQDTWTLAEAVQAIVILANYHALSSLCLGVVGTRTNTSVFKIDKYLQMKGRGRLRGSKTGDASSEAHLGLQQQQQAPTSSNTLTLLDLKSSRLTLLDERKKWRQAQKELKRKRSFSEGEVNSQTELLLKRALGESEGVKNMESKEELGRELLVQEFSWDDQGFCVMSNFYSDIAVLLDDKFRLAHSLVDTMEENKEQETIFRRAVWNYVQVSHCLILALLAHKSSCDIRVSSPLEEGVLANISLIVCKTELWQQGGSQRSERSMTDLSQSKSHEITGTLAHFSPEPNFFFRNQFAAVDLLIFACSASLPLINRVVD